MLKKSLFMMLVLTAIVPLLTVGGAFAAWQYPAESGYADIPTIGVEEMYANFTQSKGLIVDVRSTIEYETAHIKGAINITVSAKDFIARLQADVAKNPGIPIYFYCNGPTCLKSPLATQKAIEAGLTNSLAFYPGLPGWADKYPGDTILRGKPVSDTNKFIPSSEYKKRALGFEDFNARINADPNAMVIDIRDNIQRTSDLPITQKVLPISMDKLIPNFIRQKKNQDKTLYIFDQVGKQAEALQYELEENGYTNYYFLKKGATSVIGSQEYKK